MKRLLSAFMWMLPVLALTLPANAQITHSANGSVDAKAAEVLKKAASRFDQNVTFSVMMKAFDSNKKEIQRQSAQVKYNHGRYHLSTTGMDLYCDGTTVWMVNQTAKEVTVENVSNEDVNLFNPGRLLATYDKHFRAKYIRTESDTDVIDLQPRATRNYHKIRLRIDTKTGLVKRLEVHKYDSSREVYELSDFKRASNKEAEFTFDPAKHPDMELIDMR